MAAPMMMAIMKPQCLSKTHSRIAIRRTKIYLSLIDSWYKSYSSNNQNEKVRVRFAPSPTGFLHLGGLRTALYNFLFARSGNGTFILRVEDTDQSRAVSGAVDKLLDALKWAGIEPDEGPGYAGDFGPYTQSERLHLYQSNVETLLENGWAYPCFCTARRLELMRKDAVRRGEASKYDNRCRGLSSNRVKELLTQMTPHVIRLKLEPTPDPWEDMIKGSSVHNLQDIEGDPILMKSDGFPTYHFANVVDDHLMEVTHVLRGSEWMSSTPKHILLYKAFGWEPPQFGHLPLILNPDGSKLSKRQGDVHVEYYREAGYFPQAVLSYITTIGGGFKHSMVGSSLKQMCDTFDISDVRKNAGRLDSNWLQTANRHALHQCVDSNSDPLKTSQLILQVKDLVVQHYGDRLGSGMLREKVLSHGYIRNVVQWSLVDDRTTTAKDFINPQMAYLWVTPTQAMFAQLDTTAQTLIADFLEQVVQDRTQETFTVDALMPDLKSFMKERKLKAKKFFSLMRLALTGFEQGAPLAETMAVLGKDNVVVRLETALGKHSSSLDKT